MNVSFLLRQTAVTTELRFGRYVIYRKAYFLPLEHIVSLLLSKPSTCFTRIIIKIHEQNARSGSLSGYIPGASRNTAIILVVREHPRTVLAVAIHAVSSCFTTSSSLSILLLQNLAVV